MYSTSILKRKTDGKTFKVTMLAHWSDIQAEDGEKDSVKYLWGGINGTPVEMISHKGETYIVQPEEPKP
jgi:hypothetical protein